MRVLRIVTAATICAVELISTSKAAQLPIRFSPDSGAREIHVSSATNDLGKGPNRDGLEPTQAIQLAANRAGHSRVLKTSTGRTAGKRAISGPIWAMFHHDMKHTGLSVVDTRTDRGILRWQFGQDRHNAVGRIQPFSSPAVGQDGTVYIASWNGLTAINPQGVLKWTFATTAYGESSTPAIGADNTIYFGSLDGHLYAINPNGKQRWSFSAHGAVSSPTVGFHKTIYFGSYDGNLYAVNPNGTRKWQFDTGDKVPMIPAISPDGTIFFSKGALHPNGTVKWKLQPGLAEAPKFSAPAVASDGSIYFGTSDGYLHAFSSDGAPKWNFHVDQGYVFASPALAEDGTVYFGVNGSDYFYAVAPNGTLKWKFTTKGNVLSSAAVGGDGTIYFGCEDGHFYALDATGRMKWRFPRAEADKQKRQEYESPKTGRRGHRNPQAENSSSFHPINVASTSSPAIGIDGTLYFASLDGHLYALH